MTDKSGLEGKLYYADKKMPDTSGLVEKTGYNAKISEITGKINRNTGLATTAVLNDIKNNIPSVSDLVKKTDNYAKIKHIEAKY